MKQGGDRFGCGRIAGFGKVDAAQRSFAQRVSSSEVLLSGMPPSGMPSKIMSL